MYEGCWGANKITIRSGQKGELALFFICLGCIKKVIQTRNRVNADGLQIVFL